MTDIMKLAAGDYDARFNINDYDVNPDTVFSANEVVQGATTAEGAADNLDDIFIIDDDHSEFNRDETLEPADDLTAAGQADELKQGSAGAPSDPLSELPSNQQPANQPSEQNDSEPSEPIGAIDPDLNARNLQLLLLAEIKRKGFAGHHIDSMNEFYNNGIRQILSEVFRIEGRVKNTRDKTEEDREIDYITFLVEFTNIDVRQPISAKYKSGIPQKLMPNTAVIKNLTLSCPMSVDITVTAVATYRDGTKKTRTDSIKNHRIGSMICMEKSCKDHTTNMPKSALVGLGEDPMNIGGSFIIRGGRWAVSVLESLTYNQLHVYHNMHKGEVVRGEYISKPGDGFENSNYIVMRYMDNAAITIQLQTSKKEKFEVPFYLVFRAMGITSDREIVDHIVYGVDNTDEITTRLKQILEKSFAAVDSKFKAVQKSTDRNEILYHIALKINENANNIQARKDENVTKYLTNSVLNTLDRFIFPHIGTTANERARKLRFMGHLINIMLRVSIGVYQATDRDSYRNKRVHPAGTSLSKVFKKDVNVTVVGPLKQQLTKDFISSPFSQVDLAESVRQAINSSDLERVMTRTISSGSDQMRVKQTSVTTRVSSQTLYPKNDLNVKSVMNTIDTPSTSSSKSNERADFMRRAHSTHLGFNDPTQSPDTGEKVGMPKQMACTTSISMATESYMVKRTLLADPLVIKLDDVTPSDISARGLAKLFVNGDWIGCCPSAHLLAAKYRGLRRTGGIHHTVSIVWEPLVREIYFWTDVGRLLRPLIVVYNNIAEYIALKRSGKPAVFQQWIKLTAEHLRGLSNQTITMTDLLADGVIDYISPEEQENTYLAESVDVLREHATDVLHQFTHMDIPQAILGLITLSSPLCNHASAIRNTYFTNHRKQAAGWPVLNYAHCMVKNMTFQHYCEFPLVSTITDQLVVPTGANTRVAFCCNNGKNQEDSCEINASSVDRGLFNQTHYNVERSELEKGESFGDIDPARTLDVKKGVDYSKCVAGFVREKQQVGRDTVLIAKTAKIPNPSDQFTAVDKSTIYRGAEEIFIDSTVVAHNEDGNYVAKVKYSSFRPISIGDKVSSRTGNKGICCYKRTAADMPYTIDGETPDIIVNCHSLPTRMAVNQIMAGLLGLLAVKTGKFIDATTFNPVDIESANEILRGFGITSGGHTQMYSGETGEPIDTLIYFVPDTYQQLQKFVMDENYAIQTGPTQALTHQPLEGKAYNGGLRMGEMEVNVKESQGCGYSLQTKLYDDSDGCHIYLCRTCGKRAIVNERKLLFKCKKCGNNTDPVRVPSSWMSNVLMHELEAANIAMRFDVEQPIFSK